MHQSDDLISVLMPAYNSSSHIRDAIVSILNQSYSKFEFIIINDGSTDETEEIINTFNDKRIIYHKNERNLGIIESLNIGIKLAKGTYIARMDADDLALSNRFEEQLKTFKDFPEAVAVGSDYYNLKGNKITISEAADDSDFLKTLLLFATCFCHPTVMIKNILLEKAIKYNKDFMHAEDYKLWTDLVFEGEFRNTKKPLLKYRSHATQISVYHSEKQLQISSRIRKEYLVSLGFKFTESQFDTHNVIGNNEFIKSKELLVQIEEWLCNLIEQNKDSKRFNEISFNKAIHKFWLDSCGNTNIGLRAYRLYFTSHISMLVSISLKQKLILFSKCLLRALK